MTRNERAASAAIARLTARAPTERHGVPSYADASADPDSTVEEVADAVERGGIAAARDALATARNGDRTLATLRSTGDTAWRHLTDAPLHGPCLDATAGFGTRAHVLAERGRRVCALDPDLHRLRVAAARDDFDTEERVTPVHGDISDVPVSADAFRTVIADDGVRDAVAGEGGLRTAVDALARTLAPDGTLVLTLDGWPRRTGLDARLWAARDRADHPASIRAAVGRGLRSTAAAYRSLLADAGFADVSLYALLPSRCDSEFAFAVDDRAAVERFVSEYVHSPMIRRLIGIADRFGLLGQAYPGYLAVCSLDGSDTAAPAPDRDAGTLLRPGYNRSVAFDLADGGLDRVRKLPNAASRAATTWNETAVLRGLRDDAAADDPIVGTLPDGRTEPTADGPVRVEAPASGTSLVDRLGDDPESLYRTLSAALSWLASLQTAFRGDDVRRQPDEVAADLTAPGAEVAPPTPDAPVELFRAPVHGDFHLWNVYVADGRVSTVIDWEFAARDGLSTADVGTLLQYAWTNALGSHERGFEAVVARETPHAAAVRRAVAEYCDAVGTSPRTVGRYLTHGPARALRFAAENPALHAPWTEKFAEWTDRVRKRDAAVRSFFARVDAE